MANMTGGFTTDVTTTHIVYINFKGQLAGDIYEGY